MDIVSKKVRSRMMAAVKGKNTALEKLVFVEMKKRGIRFKKHYGKLPGSPDLALPQIRKAIFIDGDFWHGYRYPVWQNKITSPFWRKKIEANRLRDRRNFRKLRRLGWQVIRIWGHDIKKSPTKTFQRIYDFVSRRSNLER